MKKQQLVTIALCVALMAAIVVPLPALAGNISKFSGDSADASFSQVDATGCIYTNVSVFANTGKNQNPPGAPGSQSSVGLWISQYDTCTATEVLTAFGSGVLGNQDFQLSNKLNSAMLNTAVNAYDYVSGATLNITVALNWTGIGDVNKGTWSSSTQAGKCKTSYRSTGSWRSAQATGTVASATTNYTPNPSVGASLSTTKNGSLEIGCN